MKLITRATTNYFYPTTREKELLTSPSYIVKFVSDDGRVSRYCACTDSSLFPNRYQKFTIIETTTPTNLTNEIKLDKSRFWKYYIYEISAAALALVTDFTTVDYDALNEVEQGRAKVTDASATVLSTYTGYQTTYSVYAG